MVAGGMTWRRILLLSLSWLLLTARPAYAVEYLVPLPKEPSELPAKSNDYNVSIMSDLKLQKGDTVTFNGGGSEIASVTSKNPDEVAVGAPYQLSNGNWNFDVKPGPTFESGTSGTNTVIVVNYKNGKKRALIINPLGKVNYEAKGSTLTLSFAKEPNVQVTLGGWLPAATPAPEPPKEPDRKDDDKGGGY